MRKITRKEWLGMLTDEDELILDRIDAESATARATAGRRTRRTE